ncbi:MAG: phosphoenolpyruvate carboxylase [Chloroflexi bacterium]|nr:MAG: phosphoenolpyruvate carboxylase [Chloroflexota bacterium]MBL1194636.1 phosphoenolpyruvate carboxylase [Chloroflexota bacterium]NOH11926.1 phosphoenolpyruvate carboxylase [Chloroflexota bacterium]
MELSAKIRLLGDTLGHVITTQESKAIFDIEENIRQLSKDRRAGELQAGPALAGAVAELNPDQARAVASAFALYFDLVNLAEESHRVNVLRERLATSYPEAIAESITKSIRDLKAQGVTSTEMQILIDSLHIESVLTAHPTQSKRRTILSKLERITLILRELDYPDLLPQDRDERHAALLAEVTNFWLTSRSRSARPEVTDEVRTGLYFIDQVFWDLLPRLYTELEDALAEHYPDVQVKHAWYRMASWVGGDRDGNPNVTHEITAETLRLHRGLAVEKHREAFKELSRRLSFDIKRLPLPSALQAWFEARRPLPPHVAYLEDRYSNEPYRLALSLLSSDLAYASREDMRARLLSDEPHAARAKIKEYTAPLSMIAGIAPKSVAGNALGEVQRQLEIFGLHAARLDFREESSRLTATIAEILRGLGRYEGFEKLSEAERADVLSTLLDEPVPALADRPGITPETAETWSVFKLLARVKAVYGSELLGPFIISMTRGVADVLTVLLLARWAGFDECLDIVPLFETVDDLVAAPEVLSTLFTHQQYKAHLESCQNEQTVMIGYSDSNKDGGYLAAQWALYQAQEAIAETCRQCDVNLTLFHGRGGTVARGGGPANRAIRAQPPGTINGRFRVTEQGESITSRYANLDLAYRHLEQVTSAVLLSSSPRRELDGVKIAWRAAMTDMASVARDEFRSLVYETDGFLEYWREATPLEEITRLRIGSRPATRGPGGAQVTKIRAIPWVFSWMQSRFNLPGWYGLGTGLEAASDPDLLKTLYREWSFFRALMDNAEMSLLKADLGIAALYSDLVTDKRLASSIFERISAEYERTRNAILAINGNQQLMDDEPVIQRSIELRNPYVDPLNYIQVEMLKRLRTLDEPEGPQAEPLREVVVMTINGIAAGLRNTG